MYKCLLKTFDGKVNYMNQKFSTGKSYLRSLIEISRNYMAC